MKLSNSDIYTAIGKLSILKLLGKGKSGYSYLARHNGNHLVFKQMHNEPCSYYNFSGNKTRLEVESYNRLKALGIPMPELLDYNFDQNYLVKEFIDGKTGSEIIAEDKVTDEQIGKLFRIYHILKNADMNIDYFPSNFILTKNDVYYIDYESNHYLEEWDLVNWGIYYWANPHGFKQFLALGDAKHINQNLEKGIPYKKEFEHIIQNWINKFLGNHETN